MCLGDNESDGPRRCEGEALARCQRAQANADAASSTTLLLEAERDHIEQDFVQVDDLIAALNGTLPPEREAELLDRAERFRHDEQLQQLRESLEAAEQDDTPNWRAQISTADTVAAENRATWQDAVDADAHRQSHPELIESDADLDARLRGYYEDNCRDDGSEATPDGLADYISTERMAIASHDQWQSDVREGADLARARQAAIDNHRGLAESLDIDELNAEIDQRVTADEFTDLIGARDAARTELEEATEAFNAAKQAALAGQPNDLDSARERLNEA